MRYSNSKKSQTDYEQLQLISNSLTETKSSREISITNCPLN